MFYFLSKFLPLLVYPAGLAFGLLVLALLLRNRKRLSTALTALGLVVIWLGGNRIFSMSLLRALEWQYPPLAQPERIEADAIVVLGGGTRQQLPPRPTHELGEAGDRVVYAARLYRAGVAPVIVVSGAHGPLSNDGQMPESQAMADLLVFFGVPREAIITEDTSQNTYENGVESARLLAANGLSEIVLVTSAMHMPRAYGVFEKLDLSVIPAPTDYVLTRSDWAFYTQPRLDIQVMNLLPAAEHMELTEKALKELIGTLVYRLRGWL
ncbi:MAG: YdcF family protein [Anaerolineae bacterium]